MRPSIQLVAMLVISLVASAVLPTTGRAAETTASRLLKYLTSPKALVRVRTLRKLAEEPDRLARSTDDLIDAYRQHSLLVERGVTADVLTSASLLLDVMTQSEDARITQVLGEAIQGPSVQLSVLASDAAGNHQRHDLIPNLVQTSDQPVFDLHYGRRFAIVRALIKMRHPDAIAVLEALSKRLDGRLQAEIDLYLNRLTELDFAGDVAAMKAFYGDRNDKRSGDVALASGIVLSEDEAGSQTRPLKLTPQYYGIRIDARRLVFVLDCSGSMDDRAGSLTRLQRAKRELVQTIQQLPEETEFNIMPYNVSVGAWQSTLQPATEANKQSAVRFVSQLIAVRDTNTHGALRRAMAADDNVEAVFLLSDGQPTCGRLVKPADILSDIATENRFRNVSINTFGITLVGDTRAFMAKLAEQNAGDYRDVH
ncbi:MAG: VWA domain-containing protein [Planctomycetota bacterium]